MKKLKNISFNILLLLISISLTFCFCEFVFRKAIFDLDNKAFDKYRKPPLYASDWDPAYWKLLKVWQVMKPNRHSYPDLGWLNWQVWPGNLARPEVWQVGKKRPVLLYGDSYAQELDTAKAVRKILYEDSVFSSQYHFIDYGSGAYGLDQMHTLLSKTSCKFEKPIVIFSFLTLDLDRSVLDFRDGQKPQYSVDENGKLKINSSRYMSNDIAYLKKYPPEVGSYLWRKFLYSEANFLPEKLTQTLTGELSNREIIKKLNSKLIEGVAQKLRSSQTDFMFLLWEAPSDFKISDEKNWRKVFIEEQMKKNNIKYFWAKDILPERISLNDSTTFYKYYVLGDGHPTPYFYTFVAKEIRKKILGVEYEVNSKAVSNNISSETVICHPTYQEQLDSAINVINSDTLLLVQTKKASIEKNEPFEKSLFEFAKYLLWQKYSTKE